MIPKEVTDALNELEKGGWPFSNKINAKIVRNFLETSDRYMRDLEQHVDDLAASYGGTSD